MEGLTVMKKDIFERAKIASRALSNLDESQINSILLKVADKTELQYNAIMEANRKDLERMDASNPMFDRLVLTKERIFAIAADLRNIAALQSPVGEILSETVRPNGMKITKVRVPFGVIGVIYEARPNVSFDVFGLCFKSNNAVILKGGSDANFSNEAIVELIRTTLADAGVNPDVVTLLPSDRLATAELLDATYYVDLIIPRGSSALINYVRENSRVPVIETGAGICHTYFDRDGDTVKGAAIIFNAKTRRVSVCNALDTLVIHADRVDVLPELCNKLADKNVIIYADHLAYKALEGKYPANLLEHADDDSFGIEFLDYKMSIKTVDTIDDAINHITVYSSRHSETIITEDKLAANLFVKKIDVACVYVNVSTAFTDGAQFGFGVEIGISTQKMHARGPMALAELTSYKYIITGNGQVRS
ncbi:MAG: glutamate-5-semialdehyde dehydrogenase [Prevotellaceae bacterium]|jgi:glutamate-5-semialdehyde dehydrogenase|nr:glutamate-5-semialdehyde dehydrogenase [Prevotellaceae bacterium]